MHSNPLAARPDGYGQEVSGFDQGITVVKVTVIHESFRVMTSDIQRIATPGAITTWSLKPRRLVAGRKERR